jgi:hypothetical protein
MVVPASRQPARAEEELPIPEVSVGDCGSVSTVDSDVILYTRTMHLHSLLCLLSSMRHLLQAPDEESTRVKAISWNLSCSSNGSGNNTVLTNL